ncbi:MAG: GT-D fold domain-containing glycosyltransferase [Lachnospiraceae bacterium]|nr:GT-D fold domain-containing glycosyltransferase [Lachnospiraceae bacterium]
MSNILVFSKNRPMQLHAYLESLMMFSKIEWDKISVLYSHKDNISYEKVKGCFPRVNWIYEIDFEKQLKKWISDCNDEFMMFGCDDVVFKDYFCIAEMENFLKNHEDVFGVSVRLGNNLVDYPRNVCHEDGFCMWDWHAINADNFHYPWELDCTIYRTCDVKSIIEKCMIQIKNPNYFEEFVELSPDTYISRDKLACYDGQGKAIVITVNRVQDTHCNPIDDSRRTDPETLSYLYNKKGYRLDIVKISRKKNKVIHVDSSYFILIPKLPKTKRNGKIIRRCKRLLKNLVYLSSIDLRRDSFNEFINSKDVEIYNIAKKYYSPKILSPEATLELLENNPKSFTRFGDGELSIMTGTSIPFQKFEIGLQEYLQKLIKNNYENIYVGLPYFYYQPTFPLTSKVRSFVLSSGKKYRDIINRHSSPDKIYIDTAITQLYQTYDEYDFSDYFKRVRKLFKGKKILLIIGEGIYSVYQHNLFVEAAEFSLLEAPKKNAYTELDKIMNQIKEYDKEWLICTVLGPTSKVITVEATELGYMVWDIGHLVKDYNYYMEGMPRTNDVIEDFYRPD